MSEPSRRPDPIGGSAGARRPGAPQGRVKAVTDDVRVALWFHLGSVIQISTSEGPVVVDTTGALGDAGRARDALAEHDAAPTHTIVYTHCHPDHCGGAAAFESDALTQVVSQEELPGLWDRDMRCLEPWHHRIRSWQRGLPLEAGYHYDEDGGRGFLEPTVTFRDALDLEVGGTRLHLEHTQGETRDHLLVWLPDQRVLLPGDLYYAAFPNLSSPAIGPRPIREWVESLDRMLELDAEHLVPSHTNPVSGRDRVRHVLTTYRDAIEHVWIAVEQALNDGLDVDEAAATITLPEHLAAEPFLAERYGTVAWGVRAVYDRLTGWYDGRPASLNPLPRAERAADVVDVAGADALAARARARLDEGRLQLALELASLVIDAEPSHAEANAVCAEACRALVKGATSINEMGFYTAGARLARHRAEAGAEAGAG